MNYSFNLKCELQVIRKWGEICSKPYILKLVENKGANVILAYISSFVINVEKRVVPDWIYLQRYQMLNTNKSLNAIKLKQQPVRCFVLVIWYLSHTTPDFIRTFIKFLQGNLLILTRKHLEYLFLFEVYRDPFYFTS